MVTKKIKAVSFDFWNTLFKEITPSISSLRADLLLSELLKLGHDIQLEKINSAIDEAWDCHRRVWNHGGHLSTASAASTVSSSLGLAASGGTIRTIRDCLEFLPELQDLSPSPELRTALQQLHEKDIFLAVISDTGFAPGKSLLVRLQEVVPEVTFGGRVFSDEIGLSKPSSKIFEAFLSQAGCNPNHAVHVGDIWKNDIAGARSAGMLTARITNWNDDKPISCEQDADFVSSDLLKISEWILAYPN